MKSAIETSANEILQILFNSFCDAHAGDVKFHANCMVVNVDKVLTQNQTENITEKQLIKRYAVEEELVSKIEYEIHTGSVYEMKGIYTSYIESLKENNIAEIRSEKYLKMHLKEIYFPRK